jgi:hypothetical protein
MEVLAHGRSAKTAECQPLGDGPGGKPVGANFEQHPEDRQTGVVAKGAEGLNGILAVHGLHRPYVGFQNRPSRPGYKRYFVEYRIGELTGFWFRTPKGPRTNEIERDIEALQRAGWGCRAAIHICAQVLPMDDSVRTRAG